MKNGELTFDVRIFHSTCGETSTGHRYHFVIQMSRPVQDIIVLGAEYKGGPSWEIPPPLIQVRRHLLQYALIHTSMGWVRGHTEQQEPGAVASFSVVTKIKNKANHSN